MKLWETVKKYHENEDNVFQVVFATWNLGWSEAYCTRINEYQDDPEEALEWIIDDVTEMILESTPKHLRGIVDTVLSDLTDGDWEEVFEVLQSIEAYEDEIPEAV